MTARFGRSFRPRLCTLLHRSTASHPGSHIGCLATNHLQPFRVFDIRICVSRSSPLGHDHYVPGEIQRDDQRTSRDLTRKNGSRRRRFRLLQRRDVGSWPTRESRSPANESGYWGRAEVPRVREMRRMTRALYEGTPGYFKRVRSGQKYERNQSTSFVVRLEHQSLSRCSDTLIR